MGRDVFDDVGDDVQTIDCSAYDGVLDRCIACAAGRSDFGADKCEKRPYGIRQAILPTIEGEAIDFKLSHAEKVSTVNMHIDLHSFACGWAACQQAYLQNTAD